LDVVDGLLGAIEVQQAADVGVEALVVEGERDLVEVGGVHVGDDTFLGDVAKEGDLGFQASRDGPVAAEHDDVGLDPSRTQFGDRVLGRLGLLFSRGAEVGDQGHVHIAHVVAPHVLSELADRLQEREDFDVAHRAADLGDDDVGVICRDLADAQLDLVGDVRDHLDRLSEVLTPALLGDHGLVDRTCGGVGITRQRLVYEPLVVPEVEVRLATVVGHEDLPVLEGVHGPRVDVYVRVELLDGHPEPPALQEAPKRRRGEALA
jgi:hypothetical protein